jgi:hypothetical protein
MTDFAEGVIKHQPQTSSQILADKQTEEERAPATEST